MPSATPHRFDESLLKDYRATATGSEALLLETALRMFYVHRDMYFALEPKRLTQRTGTNTSEGTATLVLRQLRSMGAIDERADGLFESAAQLLHYLDKHPPDLS